MGKNAESQALREQRAKIDQKLVLEGKFIQVRRDVIEFDDHPTQTWDLVIHPGAVAIIPIDNHGRLVLVEQWRRAIRKITIEIPAGMLEKGEAPELCAQRELREETGYRAKTLIPFGGCYAAPGISDEYLHLFIAKGLEKSPLIADDTEVIDVRTVSLEEAFNMIEEGLIHDAKTIVGILRYMNLSFDS